MCDYSLHHVKSRQARVGETLISRKFENSITRGFASPDEKDVAVCLMPGTELRFEKDVELVSAFRFLPGKKIRANVARFRQVGSETLYAHRDALEFPDGRVVLLTHLREGQRATVLQLPAGTRSDGQSEQAQPVPAAKATGQPRWIESV